MKSKKNYSEDHILAMFEEIKSQGTIAIEQCASLTEKVDLILEDIDEMKSDIVEIKSELVEVNGRLSRVEDDVIEIKHRLSEKVDRDEFNKMEKRLVKLEKLVLAKLA